MTDEEMPLLLARLDKARQYLAACRDAPQAKRLADMAKAAEVFARRQKSKEARLHAHGVWNEEMA